MAPSLTEEGDVPVFGRRWNGRGGTRHEPAREDGEFMEISLSETVMHVSPISVTKRLLATFCPRDNSPLFFMVCTDIFVKEL